MGKVKEILCLHHSHLDIGYTHPQPLLMELQRDYIDEAIDLCVKTEDYPEESKFRWTCEATYPVLKWLESASEERIALFKKYLNNGQMSISAMMMHATPLANSDQLARLLHPIKELREKFNIPINTAINHDVNGQPWPISQILLDAGIDFYITGINIHFGGIPFKRPSVFNWQTPDNRQLLTFLGEHYSLFSQFFETSEADTALMAKGIKEYVERLESNGYEYDFIYLTATNPPLFDNNCPDPELADLIRKFNEEGHDITIRFVTPEMLLAKVRSIDEGAIPVRSGDWTDYWNFGSGSSAKETRLSRKTKQGLKKAEFLEAIQGNPGAHYDRVKNEVIQESLLYEEHTWGASQNITDPDQMEVYSQKAHKAHMAYQAADLSAYLLGKQMEALANNPLQSNEPNGILLVNTSGVKQQVPLYVPEEYLYKGRHLSARRLKNFLPYAKDDNGHQMKYFGTTEIDPFSWKKIPFHTLEKQLEQSGQSNFTVTDESIETPYYKMTFNKLTGRITELVDKVRNWSMLDETSDWTFFEFVRESIDPLHHKEERTSLFPRDVDLGNQSISVWNHDWYARRTGAKQVIDWNIEKTNDTVTFVIKLEVEGMKSLEQRITFSAHHPRINLEAMVDKADVREPESIFFAFPLKLEEGWRSQFDTAGMFVELDEEQLGNVSRDWVTVDQTVSIYDQHKGLTLSCPDAPLVQIGDFNFGKESATIEKNENPLLLAWPMNNYWDTNFWASQPGVVQFKYELSPFDEFNPVDVYNAGVTASEPVVLNAAIHCPGEEDGQLLTGDGDNIVPLYIKPAADKDGFIITLRNLSEQVSSYQFAIPNSEIEFATLVNTLEEFVEDIEIKDNKVELQLRGRELVHLRVKIK